MIGAGGKLRSDKIFFFLPSEVGGSANQMQVIAKSGLGLGIGGEERKKRERRKEGKKEKERPQQHSNWAPTRGSCGPAFTSLAPQVHILSLSHHQNRIGPGLGVRTRLSVLSRTHAQGITQSDSEVTLLRRAYKLPQPQSGLSTPE